MIETEKTWWQDQGYIAGRHLGLGVWKCVADMNYTWRLMLCTTDSVHEFYCYPKDPPDKTPTEAVVDVLLAWDQWDGRGDPADGWVKHFPSFRRRTDGTAETEYQGDI